MKTRLIAFVLALLALTSVASAQQQVPFTYSQLPSATVPLAGTELAAVQQGGALRQTAVSNLPFPTSAQTANTVLAGPSSGASASPTFRKLVGADLPNPTTIALGGAESSTAPSNQFATGLNTSGSLTYAQPAFTNISGTALVSQGGTGVTTGTPGGILVFTGSTTLVSSAALTSSMPVIGGGAGHVVSVGTISGNTSEFATVSGALVSGNCLKSDANHNIVDQGAGCATGAGGTVGQVQYNSSGSLAGFTMAGDCTLVPSTGSITCLKTNGSLFASAATTNIGTSGATIPLLSTANTWSLGQTIASGVLQLPPGSNAAPSLIFGDTSTGLYRPSTNAVAFSISGTEQMLLDSAGLLSVGVTPLGSGIAVLDASFQSSNSVSGSAADDVAIVRAASTGSFATLGFYRAQGTVGSPAVAASSQMAGGIFYRAYDGSNYTTGATIEAIVAATPTPGSSPMQVQIATAKTSGSLTQALLIDDQQDVIASTGSALPTTSTGGFLMANNMAGAPTGTPASDGAGFSSLIVDNSYSCFYFRANSAWNCAPGTNDYYEIGERENSGTNSSTTLGGSSFTKIVSNELSVRPAWVTSYASSQFLIGATGTYDIEGYYAITISGASAACQIALKDVTAGTHILPGLSEGNGTASVHNQLSAPIWGRTTLTSGHVYEFDGWSSSNILTAVAVSSGASESYSDFRIKKVS